MANMKLPNLPSENEISDFLSKVDEIDTVLKGLNSSDDDNVTKYISQADSLIKKVEKEEEKKKKKEKDGNDEDFRNSKTGFNKTSINKDAYKNETAADNEMTGPALPEGGMNQGAFMAAMEADAVERSERRKVREKAANEWKEKGNTEFKQGNYAKALEFYDKAMSEQKDSVAIYTNRAQTRIKLGMYQDALTDCDWALRLWPNCLKALVHQGHAYLGVKDYDKARESYRMILDIDNRKEAMVNDYLASVDREEQASLQEQKASALFDEGNDLATGVVNILTRINREEQLPIYYSGGFRTITTLLVDVASQTLFRTHGGLQLPQSLPVLNKCLMTERVESLTMADRDLLSTAMDVFCAACSDNETSQQQLLLNPGFPDQLNRLMDAQFKGQGRILKTSCLNLLHSISLTPAGRSSIVTQFDISRLVSSLFMLMTKHSASYSQTAAALLNNLALEKRLKIGIRDEIHVHILPAFESLLKSNKTPAVILSLACSTFTNLAIDVMIRNKMAARSTFWSAVSDVLNSSVDSKLCSTLESGLGLLMNVGTGLTPSTLSTLIQDSNTIHQSCFNIIQSHDQEWTNEIVVSRSLVVLSLLLPHSESACLWFAEDCGKILMLMEFIKRNEIDMRKPAMKCLTVLTQNVPSVKDTVAENKGTSMLLRLLQKDEKEEGVKKKEEETVAVENGEKKTKEDEEVIVGNAVLCLSHLAARNDVCAKLTKTNIIQRLLVLARDGRKEALQSNAAILVGKLVKGDSRHLERLRELHGIEILHQCMTHIK